MPVNCFSFFIICRFLDIQNVILAWRVLLTLRHRGDCMATVTQTLSPTPDRAIFPETSAYHDSMPLLKSGSKRSRQFAARRVMLLRLKFLNQERIIVPLLPAST